MNYHTITTTTAPDRWWTIIRSRPRRPLTGDGISYDHSHAGHWQVMNYHTITATTAPDRWWTIIWPRPRRPLTGDGISLTVFPTIIVCQFLNSLKFWYSFSSLWSCQFWNSLKFSDTLSPTSEPVKGCVYFTLYIKSLIFMINLNYLESGSKCW